MSEQLEMTLFLIERLESAGIPYMLTGSVAMSTYIAPRMTMDVDLVVECDQTKPGDWIDLFGEDCYISIEAVQDAQARGGMFNIIHNQLIAKADIIVRRNSEYRKLEFSRRQVRSLADRDVFVVSPEDLFLSKLVWWKESDSAQQKTDLERLLADFGNLDLDYIDQWASRIGVAQQWEQIKS